MLRTPTLRTVTLLVAVSLAAGCVYRADSDVHTTPRSPDTSTSPSAQAPTVTLSPVPTSTCPAISQSPVSPPLEEAEDLTALVLGFLNTGGDPLQLPHLVSDWGQAGNVLPIVADMDQDQFPEVILAGANHDNFDQAPGRVSVLRCDDGMYAGVATFDIGDSAAIQLLAIDHRNPLGRPVVVLRNPNIASDVQFFALGWSGQAWTPFLDVYTRAGNLVVSQGPSGFTEFTIYEPTSSCISCGPSRTSVSVYGWDRQDLRLISSRLAPSAYRIHVLQDAQNSLNEGHIGEAIALYGIAATDLTLLDYPSDYELAIAAENTAGTFQRDFAQFRHAVLMLSLQPDLADWYSSMPESTQPGSPFPEATALIARLVAEGTEAPAACLEVMAQIRQQHPDLSGHDGHVGEWGTLSMVYDFASICP